MIDASALTYPYDFLQLVLRNHEGLVRRSQLLIMRSALPLGSFKNLEPLVSGKRFCDGVV